MNLEERIKALKDGKTLMIGSDRDNLYRAKDYRVQYCFEGQWTTYSEMHLNSDVFRLELPCEICDPVGEELMVTIRESLEVICSRHVESITAEKIAEAVQRKFDLTIKD